MPRYFFGENAGRPVVAAGRRFSFEILGIAGGTQQGVIAIDDEFCEAFLAVASKWVAEITKEEYDNSIAKKKQDHRSIPTPDLTPPQRPGPPLKGAGAVVVDGASLPPPAGEKELPDGLGDAVDLGQASPPPPKPVTPPVTSTKRQNHKEKRGTAAK